jgi:hypothetical protein
MEKRYFTVAEANRLVPTLEAAFGRMLRLRAQLRMVGQEFAAHGEELDDESLAREDGPPELVSARGRARALFERLGDELRAVHDLGVQVKDLETGLCDFVARRQGRDVFLCWRLGEKSIAFWHELATGFAGRRPIDAHLEALPQ